MISKFDVGVKSPLERWETYLTEDHATLTWRSSSRRIWNSRKVDGPGLRITRIWLGGDTQWRRWLDGSCRTLISKRADKEWRPVTEIRRSRWSLHNLFGILNLLQGAFRSEIALWWRSKGRTRSTRNTWLTTMMIHRSRNTGFDCFYSCSIVDLPRLISIA